MDNENSGKISLEELAELLKQAKKIAEEKTGEKITHQMIADAVGVDRVSVTLWEQGKRHPGFLNIVNYCQFLGITVDELLGVKKTRYLHLVLSEEERGEIFLMLKTCKAEVENTPLYDELHTLEQHLHALFSRAHPQ